jgi:hypothetical protein
MDVEVVETINLTIVQFLAHVSGSGWKEARSRMVAGLWIACEALEKQRRKDCPTTPFGVDLNAPATAFVGSAERRKNWRIPFPTGRSWSAPPGATASVACSASRERQSK